MSSPWPCACEDKPTISSHAASSAYDVCVDKARSVGLKAKQETLKEKIGKIFNFGESCKRPKIENPDDDDFLPTPSYHSGKSKGKGKLGGGKRLVKGNLKFAKRKVKAVRFRVVSVSAGTTTTPVNRSEKEVL